ncbi:type VII secretion protein EccB [Pauljensenia sp. UMB0018B]|jgi:hypothetical protein|uniref:Type VII secretion protein EccB n=1 Tax=Schaalia odontolytica TaxID=1660 RepID=A0A2I1I260_9ACTO|nr:MULTISPECIES: type VII secretion protein EccB [Actinomycetaceae]EJN46632.1 putative type VII secretion protein EccB [Actinomyces sp. ICM39]MDK7340058.1 type VII secretion protein EccB [Pauljensenia sp. UMB0018B]PKY65227.1 hypothetical protein CYJ22_01720 [Schaalia odontolytica]
MPSSKDILEAQRFNRHRLITAFTSGTPGGREVDPPSPVRPLIFGALVAIIMCVIGVGMRFFNANPNLDSKNFVLVDVKSTGARYFLANGVLHPISNVTTARLLSQEGTLEVISASASSLDDKPRGAQIGLPGVPDDVPTSKQLASTWLSCDLEDTYHTWIGQKLPEENFPLTPAVSALVTPDHGKTIYFVDAATEKKYLIDETDSRLSDWTLAFQNRVGYPVEVDPQWVDLFPSGTPLRSWSYSEIPNAGAPATDLPGPLKDANLTIGTVVEQTDAKGEVQFSYLVVNSSQLAVFNSTAARLYRDAPATRQFGTDMFKDVTPVHADFIGEDWPRYEDFSDPVWNDQKADASNRTALCAHMSTTNKAVPKLGLYTMPYQRAVQASYDAESVSSPSGPTTTRTVTVAGGSGALVAITSAGGQAAAYAFVSDQGYIHSLGATPTVSMNALGWKQDDVAAIPETWANLIPPGTDMTPQAAASSVGLS